MILIRLLENGQQILNTVKPLNSRHRRTAKFGCYLEIKIYKCVVNQKS